jgi:hypothetical protein
MKLIDPTELDISSSTQYEIDVPRMDILKSGFFPIMTVFVQGGEEMFSISEIDTVGKPTLKILELDANYTMHVERTVEYVRCSEIDNEYKNTLLQNNPGNRAFFDAEGLCPNFSEEDFQELYLQGSILKPPFRWVDFNFTPCSNPDPTLCMDVESLSSMRFLIIMPQISFDPKNKKNPTTINSDADFRTFLSSNVVQKKEFIFRKVEIEDDNWIDFTNEKLTHEYVELDLDKSTSVSRQTLPHYCSEDPADGIPCIPYINIEFVAGKKKIIIKRDYAKIFGTLGEMGGIKEALLGIAAVLMGIYRFFVEDKFVEEQVFRMKKEDAIKLFGANGKEKEKEVEELMEEVQESATDGIEMMKAFQNMKVLEQFYFGEEERMLIPLVALNLAKKSKEAEKREYERGKNFMPKDKVQSIEEAYARLNCKQPKNEIQKQMKEFILQNLPPNLTGNFGNGQEQDDMTVKMVDIEDTENGNGFKPSKIIPMSNLNNKKFKPAFS